MNQNTYECLSLIQRQYYTKISNAIESGSNSFDIQGDVDINSIIDVLGRYLVDIPEMFWLLNKLIKTSRRAFGGGIISSFQICEIEKRTSEIKKMKKELECRVEEVINSIKLAKCKNDAETVYYIYKYIQSNTIYDYDALNRERPLSHTAYGMLVSGLSVCEGNAKAMSLLCQRFGIPCIGVIGESSGQSHEWVMVKIDGVWYHSDPTYEYRVNGVRSFEKLLQSDKELESEYIWDKYEYPKCIKHNPYKVGNEKNAQGYDEISSANNYYSEIVIPKNVARITSLPEYQRVLRAAFLTSNGECGFIFELGFGSVRPDYLFKIVCKIADQVCKVEITIKYEYYREKRFMLIRWEEV